MTDTLYRWVKASERPLPEGSGKLKKSILFKGEPLSIIFLEGQWNFCEHTYQRRFIAHTKIKNENLEDIQWLEPYTVPVDVEQAAIKWANDNYHGNNDKAYQAAFNGFLAGSQVSREAEGKPEENKGSLLKEYNNQILIFLGDPTNEEAKAKLNYLKPFAEKEIEEYTKMVYSRPSFNAEDFLNKLREGNPYTNSHIDMAEANQDIGYAKCVGNARELLNQKEG